MKSFKKIMAGVCSLLMISTLATSIVSAELGNSLGESLGGSEIVTPGESENDKPDVPGESEKPDVPGESDKPITPGESEKPPVVPTGIKGDANGDGQVKSNDLLTIRKYLLKLIKTDEINLWEADANWDGVVRSNDLVVIRRYLLHLQDNLDMPTVPGASGEVPGTSD